MPRRILLYLTLVAIVGPAAARADTAHDLAAIDARLKACIDKDESTAGMVECTSTAESEADKVLNRVYGGLTAGLKKASDADEIARNREILKRLVAAERAWIAYRDAECTYRGTEMLGGSGEGLTILTCTFEMTKARAKSFAGSLDETTK